MNKKYIKYIDYIVNDIELPYIKSIEQYGLKQDEVVMVLSKLYDQPVTIKDNSGYGVKYVYNTNGNEIYYENSKGNWYKKEYDDNGNEIYFEKSNGFWVKREYNTNGDEIYYENRYGTIIDNR